MLYSKVKNIKEGYMMLLLAIRTQAKDENSLKEFNESKIGILFNNYVELVLDNRVNKNDKQFI